MHSSCAFVCDEMHAVAYFAFHSLQAGNTLTAGQPYGILCDI